MVPNVMAIEGLLTIEYCLTGNIQLQFTTGNWPYPLRSGFGMNPEGRCGQWKRYVARKEVLDSSQLSQLAVGGRVEVVEPENFEPPYKKNRLAPSLPRRKWRKRTPMLMQQITPSTSWRAWGNTRRAWGLSDRMSLPTTYAHQQASKQGSSPAGQVMQKCTRQ